MSSYIKALESINEYKTIAKHISGLGQVAVNTEDTELKSAIEAAITQLQMLHAKVTNKSTPISLEKVTSPEVKVVINYCKRAIGTKKPEWQILAERNGWAVK